MPIKSREKCKNLENEKSFRDEIKSIFHHFWRAIIEAIKKNFFGGWESDFNNNIFYNDLCSVFITFYVWNNVNLDKLDIPWKDGSFCIFHADMLWGKCNRSFFTNCNKYWQLKKIPIWRKFRVFRKLFLRVLIVKIGGKEKVYSKIAAFKILQVSK